jgi:hypothetical protein
MAFRIEFEINDLPKTINAIGRSHWSIKAKEAKKWKTLVANQIISTGCCKLLFRAQISLFRYSSRCPDSDGLVSSFKHVIDGIVGAGLLPDDSYRTIGMPDYRWEKAPKGKGKIKVIVEEIESHCSPG